VASPYGFPVGNETKILAHPTDPATAFVTFAGFSGIAHVARTTDFGGTWEDLSGDFPPDPANTMVVDPDHSDHWFVGSDVAVWHSSDSGVSWRPLGHGFPSVVVYDLEIDAPRRKLVAITYGRGGFQLDLTGVVGPASPPGVPSGLTGQPMTVAKLDPAGTDLSIAWDTTTCTEAIEHNLIYGTGSGLPAGQGGSYALNGAECAIGDASPFVWRGSADPALDPSRVVWWLITATDGESNEGSWGTDSDGAERAGPGPGGASGVCGIAAKDTSNTCGL
jgi:hypothetical protein